MSVKKGHISHVKKLLHQVSLKPTVVILKKEAPPKQTSELSHSVGSLIPKSVRLSGSVPIHAPKKYKKKTIPVALREQVWIKECGRVFEHKCVTPWCKNTISVFDFESGHNVPESKGGPTTLDNLVPLCRRCNNSMGDRYTFDEWALLDTAHEVATATATAPPVKGSFWTRLWSCASSKVPSQT